MTLVLLYVAEPAARERSVVRRSVKGHVRAAAMRSFDRFRWRVLKDFRIDFDAWRVVDHTNKGDAAIREAIAAQLAALPFRTPPMFVEVGRGELTERHVARLNQENGLFVIAGSGYFFFGPDNELPRRIERDIELIRRMSCARIVYGSGVNQISTDGTLQALAPATVAPRSLAMLRELAANMDLVAVRDESSRDLLAAVCEQPVHLIGDPALFLVPRQSLQVHAGQQPALVGLNFALHGPNSAASLPDRMRWIVPLVCRMRDAWQCRFRYVMHSDVERLFPVLLRQHGIETEVIDAPPQATLDAYAALDLHVCQMMHSSILAIAAGIPTVNIGYDVKNRAFFQLMGIGDLCFGVKGVDPECVFDRAARLFAEREAFAATIGAAKRRLADALARFQAEIVALMAHSSERAGAA
ncbi:polysaccharide pyruvyl transferase family protein [Elioraea tepidiphila]|uniref:polysaccharide pyruvyl transferase family protein n=1 Tax=Elioraea tepidiphila TaxID=457934 RepID=UPI00035ED30B|nr:polysaccharide pyruvyl transferase family protein [Elioraea tepidiphila]